MSRKLIYAASPSLEVTYIYIYFHILSILATQWNFLEASATYFHHSTKRPFKLVSFAAATLGN